MDWQMPLVGLGVAAAAAYIARRAWRTWAQGVGMRRRMWQRLQGRRAACGERAGAAYSP